MADSYHLEHSQTLHLLGWQLHMHLVRYAIKVKLSDFVHIHLIDFSHNVTISLYIIVGTIRIFWSAFTPVRAHRSTDESCFAAKSGPNTKVLGWLPSRKVAGR